MNHSKNAEKAGAGTSGEGAEILLLHNNVMEVAAKTPAEPRKDTNKQNNDDSRAKQKTEDKYAFVFRHREPFWAYERGQRRGTAHLNYLNKNGKRSLRLHVQIKDRRDWKRTIQQVSLIIPLPLIERMLRRIQRDGPIKQRQKITFEKLRIKHAPQPNEKGE